MRTPADVLSALVGDDPTQPALTFYDDTPGVTQGERIELSRKVLATWVAKAANALQESYDCEPGTVVHLDIPAPHWRLTYWALAIWSIGATVTVDAFEGADVLVTTSPEQAHSQDADGVIAVALPGLARDYGGSLRSGVMDEAREISAFADSFDAWDTPEPDEAALVIGGTRTTYADLVESAQHAVPQTASPARVLVTQQFPGPFLLSVLGIWAGRGSVVMVRGATPDLGDPRMQSEGVQHTIS
ncbi:MAG: TIGR03089 family protein [Ornithinimicrobium sp.]